MITTNKLKDPNLSEDDQDAIIGAFVRQRENQVLRKKWVNKLSREHGVEAPQGKQRSSAVIRKITFAVLAIAASLLLIFTLLPVLSGPSGEDLLASYLDEANIQTSRSGVADNSMDSLRNVFSTEFFREDYAAAINIGQQITGNPAVMANDQYNLGLAYLKADDNRSAITTFRDLLNEASDLETEARFYLALALLRENQSAEALPLLEGIKETDGQTIFTKAQELLNENWE